MNDHQLAPITEILPPIQHIPQARQTSQSIIRGEDGQLYRLEPVGKATANHLGGLWFGLIFIGAIGSMLLLLQAMKPAPQPAPVIIQPPPNITNPDCLFFCR